MARTATAAGTSIRQKVKVLYIVWENAGVTVPRLVVPPKVDVGPVKEPEYTDPKGVPEVAVVGSPEPRDCTQGGSAELSPVLPGKLPAAAAAAALAAALAAQPTH
eukprot:RCo021545